MKYLTNWNFNLIPENKNVIDFSNTFCLEHLINATIYFRSATPSCINLILTNKIE